MDNPRLSGLTKYSVIQSLFFFLPLLSVFFSYGFAYIFNITFGKSATLPGAFSTWMNPIPLFIISIIFSLILGYIGYLFVCLYNKDCSNEHNRRSLAYYLYIVFLLFLWPIVLVGLSSPLAALNIALIMLFFLFLSLPSLLDVNLGAFLLGILFSLYVIVLIISSSNKCLALWLK